MSVIVNAGLVLGGSLERATRMAAKPWRICATRGAFYYGGDGAAGQTRFESFVRVVICKGGVTALRLVYNSRYTASEIEQNSLLVPYTLESSVTINGTLIPVTFGGRKNPVVDPDTPFLISDVIGIDLPEDTVIQIRSAAIISAGGRAPMGLRSGGGTDATVRVRSTASVSQVYTTADMTTPAGGSTPQAAFSPVAIIGKVAQDTPSYMLFGDSQLVGIGDDSQLGTGLMGAFERALGQLKFGFSNCARSGDLSGAYSSLTSVGRYALLPYVTDLVGNMAINDINSGRTLSQILANVDALILRCKNAGVKLWYESCFVTTTSTDSWVTEANQTVASGFAVGGLRDQVNAALLQRAAAGDLIYIDTASVLINPATNKWLAGMSSDGTHVSPAGQLVRRDYLAARLGV